MAPSRKRSKGQARKAKALGAWCDSTGCKHGAQSLTKGRGGALVGMFLHEWEARQEKEGVSVSIQALNSLIVADRLCPGILNDCRNVDSVIGVFIGSGVEVISNCSNEPSWAGISGGFAACIMALEIHTPHRRIFDTINQVLETDTDEGWKRTDTITGDTRSIVDFFKKRIQCGCLDEKYAALKSQPKTGICEHCKQRAERKRLLVCSRCFACQYCSVECREANWDRHKSWCRSNPSPRYLANKKASCNT